MLRIISALDGTAFITIDNGSRFVLVQTSNIVRTSCLTAVFRTKKRDDGPVKVEVFANDDMEGEEEIIDAINAFLMTIWSADVVDGCQIFKFRQDFVQREADGPDFGEMVQELELKTSVLFTVDSRWTGYRCDDQVVAVNV